MRRLSYLWIPSLLHLPSFLSLSLLETARVLSKLSLISNNAKSMSSQQPIRSLTELSPAARTQLLKRSLPDLSSSNSYKGSSGRILVWGGSSVYTGAPYYAATAALRTGADLVTIVTEQSAAGPIKSYSPELMVVPVYKEDDDDDICGQQHRSLMAVAEINTYLDRAHCLLIGPGLGRSLLVHTIFPKILKLAVNNEIPVVLDADALFLLAVQDEACQSVKGYSKLILTPNAPEYDRLVQNGRMGDLSQAVIVRKGVVDQIYCSTEPLTGSANIEPTLTCTEPGGLKRCGGIGDVLAGVMSTMFVSGDVTTEHQAWMACCITRHATNRAFQQHGRAMCASDIIKELGPTLQEWGDREE